MICNHTQNSSYCSTITSSSKPSSTFRPGNFYNLPSLIPFFSQQKHGNCHNDDIVYWVDPLTSFLANYNQSANKVESMLAAVWSHGHPFDSFNQPRPTESPQYLMSESYFLYTLSEIIIYFFWVIFVLYINKQIN